MTESQTPAETARVMTLLYSDIEGSTRILRRSPHGYGELLSRHRAIVRSAIAIGNGIEQGTEGDSFLVLFETAAEACVAAGAIQQGMAHEDWPEGREMKVRIGVHTGEALWGAGGWTGLAIHEAARIGSAAHGGQVLVSEVTRALVSHGLAGAAAFADLGEHHLKDIDEPIRLFQLTHPELSADFPPPRSLETRQHNLPSALTSFVGRDDDLSAVTTLLRTSRLVTLVGPGGTGKTRLALEVAAGLLDAHRDGVWLVELSPVNDPSLVAVSVAAALGVREQPGRQISETLTQHLLTRDLLLMLDNCEHVIDSCCKLADQILRSCPQVRILATSRAPLDVSGEALHRVGQLAAPPADVTDVGEIANYDAVRLFAERARVAGAGGEIDAQFAGVVASICRRLDGIPLAIELAAGRLRTMSITDLERRLDHRLRVLTGGSRAAPERQQTLRAAIDWSYQSLPVGARLTLERLSVFVGGWDLDAAEAVCAGGEVDEYDVLDLHSMLIDNSLVQSVEIGGRRRYELLETIREYAAEALANRGKIDQRHARLAHRDHYLALTVEAGLHLRGPEQTKWLEHLDTEIANLRAAFSLSTVDAAAASSALVAVSAISRYWRIRGLVREVADLQADLLAAARLSPDDPIRIRTVMQMGDDLSDDVADPDRQRRSVEALEDALSSARRIGDARIEATSLRFLSWIEHLHRRQSEALRLAAEAVAVAGQAADALLLADCLIARASCGPDAGNLEASAQALSLYRQVGDRVSIGTALDRLAIAEADSGDLESACSHLSEGLALFVETGNLNSAAVARLNLGLLRLLRDEPAEAWPLFLGALQYLRSGGRVDLIAVTILGLAVCSGMAGRTEVAARLHGASDAMLRIVDRQLDSVERDLRLASVTRVRDAVGQVAFASDYEAGAFLRVDEVVELALRGAAA